MLVTARNPHMLVWSGVELIFFTVSDLGLCFEFVLETELITQGCFYFCWSGLTQSQDFFFLLLLVGVHKVMGGTQPGQLIPADPGDIPDWSRWHSRPYGVMVSIQSWGGNPVCEERLSPAYLNELASLYNVSHCYMPWWALPELPVMSWIFQEKKLPVNFNKKSFFHPDSFFIRYFYPYVSLLLDHCYKNLKN